MDGKAQKTIVISPSGRLLRVSVCIEIARLHPAGKMAPSTADETRCRYNAATTNFMASLKSAK